MEGHQPVSTLAAPVPLFPLPNVVLFPRAVLPLHIFEERYKQMTADALAGDRQVAMALLRPGWENLYYNRPQIEAVVCVGTIVSWEKLPDGKYNFLLQGHTRARIEDEIGNRLYRLARLTPLIESAVLEIDLDSYRQRLSQLFEEGALGATSLGRQFRLMLSSPLCTSDIIDIAAFNLLDDVALKQSLLAELDVKRRVKRAIEALTKLDRVVAMSMRADNPSVN